MTQTKLANLVNPEVMAQMISASLPKKIKFSPVAKIDTTLTARAGNTITVPKFAYIGDAEDVAEGVAMGTTVLTASTTQATVKKAAKGIELTDESVLSGYGDPVGEGTSQLSMAIGAKVDNDCLTALAGGSLKYTDAGIISYNGIVKAVDLFNEETDGSTKILFVSPKQVTQIRLDADFKDINKYPLKTVMTGTIGEIAGCQVVSTRKIVKDASGNFVCPIVMTGESKEDPAALTIYMKRDVLVENDRDILAGTTVVTANEHYTAVLSNDAKVVVATFKAE